MHEYFLEIGCAAVEAAKQITLRAWGSSDDELETTIKGDDHRFAHDRQKSPVTKIDKAAEQQIKSIISAAFPEHGFIGEEEGEERSDAPYKRIIDPIDGTRNYARGLPYWAILLALSHHDEIIVSIVCIPVMGELIWATKGGGSRKNGKQIHVSDRGLSEAYLLHDRHTYLDRAGKTAQFAQLCEKIAYTKSCISREMVYVATGAADAAINTGGNYYDNAPIQLLVTEAGGKVTTMSGGIFCRDDISMIVSNGRIHDQIVSALQ